VTPPEPERSPAARELAEEALIKLIEGVDDEVDVIVLGGLVPEVLTSGQDPPVPGHLGTTDVDVLIAAQLDGDQDLGSLEAALRAIDFRPDGLSWRWRGEIRGTPVKIEFLCDRPNRPEEEDIELPGCEELFAVNLRGTGFVADDWNWHILRSHDQTGTVRVRFAGLGGYLLSKISSCRTRGLPKDYYDLAYVLLHNRAGGPAEAAGAILGGPLAGQLGVLRSRLLEVRERFRTPIDVGPDSYALEYLRFDATADERELRADAVAAAKEFFGALAG
jgi:hypothetical protein